LRRFLNARRGYGSCRNIVLGIRRDATLDGEKSQKDTQEHAEEEGRPSVTWSFRFANQHR
jgi:hypothetical protein